MLDIDGFRFDKATQVTVDAQAEFGDYIRQCARSLGKENFFMPGEITGGNTFGSIYLGRGRQPDQLPDNVTQAITLTNASDDNLFLRELGKNALDAAAFHYSIYRSLTRFLGMDSNLAAGYDVPLNFVDAWNTMLVTNGLVNANTGEFDPRHMYGVTNQDVFRWPGIKDGTQKMLLGLFISTLHMPGIPLLLWGEEQAFYVLDSTASDYIFGRQSMSSSPAWQIHGCYGLGSSQYYNFPADSALYGCHDDSVSMDHRDPSHPIRNIIKSFYSTRQNYPVLNDGYFLQSLSNQTREIFLPGSNHTPTEVGMCSVMRDQYPNIQNLTGTSGSQAIWLVYQNDDTAVKYSLDCSSNDTALISPFAQGTTVKNILAPYDELELGAGPKKLGIDGSEEINGCIAELDLDAYAFKAYVLKASWIPPPPMATKFLPSHDARILSTRGIDGTDAVDIELQFSEEMDCDQITSNIVIVSTTGSNITAHIDNSTVSCVNLPGPGTAMFVGEILSTWTWKIKLLDVANGIHSITVQNATTSDGARFTNSKDRFLIRIGQENNPMVFPRLANYSQEVLFKDPISNDLYVSHKAAGADQWRYSLNWASSWSDWEDYNGGNTTLKSQAWSGTKRQRWTGEHVILQYWSQLSGSSDAVQHADLSTPKKSNASPRRLPHLFAEGPFNNFGFDQGLKNDFQLDSLDSTWKFHLMTEWPSTLQVNVWGVNPDGRPDQTMVFGDISNNSVLDRMVPDSLGETMINFTTFPPAPYLAYQLEVNDGTLGFRRVLVGNRFTQLLIYALLWTIPIATGVLSIWIYMGAFCSLVYPSQQFDESQDPYLAFPYFKIEPLANFL
jgi:alpha-1,3-glucan synthase